MGALKLLNNKTNYTIEDFYNFQNQIATNGLELNGQIINRVEYYDGKIWFMAGGTVTHARLCRNLTTTFSQKLDAAEYEPFGSEAHLSIDEIRATLHPDMFVICGELEMSTFDKNGISNAVVIIEVLSESIANYDRVGKFRKYKKIPNFKEYILVNQKQALVETFVKHDQDLWVVHHFEGINSTLKVKSLDLEIPLSSIYKNIELEDILIS